MNTTRKRYSFDELKERCIGRWEEILSGLSSVDISLALASRKHVRCHNDHGKTKNQFRFFGDFHNTGGGVCNTCGTFADGFAILNYLNGWDYKTAVKNVAEYLGDEQSAPVVRKASSSTPKPRAFELDERAEQSLRKVWTTGKPIQGTVVEDYLRKRGITAALPGLANVRFHPNLHYWDFDAEISLGYHPAMISLLRSSSAGHPLSVHRTYLSSDGSKADVPKAKKLMACSIDGAISELGAAVRLYDLEGPVMGICEGIETGMAIRSALPNLPIWAAYSANVLTNFQPPEGVKKVIVFGDVDTSGTGQVAAAKLAVRLRSCGIEAIVKLPKDGLSLPDEGKTGWYGKGATREDIERQLAIDGYTVKSSCESMDWLDCWIKEPRKVQNALSG